MVSHTTLQAHQVLARWSYVNAIREYFIGLENVCKKLDNSKYCHNYVITVEDDFEFENSEETLATDAVQNKEKQFDISNEFNPKYAQEILQSLEEKTRGQNHVIGNLDIKSLPKLSDMYLQRNPYLRNLHSSLSSILLIEPGRDINIDVIQVMILLYLRVRLFDKIDCCCIISSNKELKRIFVNP